MFQRLLLMPVLLGALALFGSAEAAPARWGQWQNALKPSGAPAAPIALARSGQTDYTIVIPTDPTPQEQKAAEELAHWLSEMTGAQFPIVGDNTAVRTHELCIGETNRATQFAKPAQKDKGLGDEGYAIIVDGERLFLLGGRKRGPINAVLALLEEDLGCRWYTKDEFRIPKRPTLVFSPVPRSFVPVLQIRDPFYHDAFNGTFSLYNRTNAPSAAVPEEWGGHVDYALFVHTFNTLVPPGEYYEEHPDYFMLTKDGKRITQQLCLTNPEVIRIATESTLRILREHPDSEIISVSKNDGGQTCQCPHCRAIDEAEGTDCGSLLHFVNAVADAVAVEFPEVKVSTLAYLETVQPPKTIRPRPNVAIQLCTDRATWAYPFTPSRQVEEFSRAMEAWEAIGAPIHIWDYCVNFSHYTAPMPNMHAIADNIRYFVNHGAAGVMEQGAYQSSGSEFQAMRCWVFAKLMWDPSLDVDELMRDFIWGYYGRAGLAIDQYNELLKATGVEHADSLAAPKGGIRYPMDSPFLSRDFLAEADRLFAWAKELAETPEILRRVELAEIPIIYVKLMRGPEFVGPGYGELIGRFETIADREKITHIAEGPVDVPQKIKDWRDKVRVHGRLGQVDRGRLVVWRLPGDWQFRTDPRDEGVRANWASVDHSTADWCPIKVGEGYGWERQGFEGYTGLGWYRITGTVPADVARKHVYLYFEAVDEDAVVFINGRQVFEHTCDSTGLAPEQIWVRPFVFEPGDYAAPGQETTLAVRVLNRMGMGGVYKPVYVVGSDQELDAGLIAELLSGRE